MAQWIIDDHGFGGLYFTCSECRKSWCDIYSDVSMEETCPNCGAPINEDETDGYTLEPPKYVSLDEILKEVNK